jgi:glycerol-3-phosphate dehydrogenase (NAD(P)+)
MANPDHGPGPASQAEHVPVSQLVAVVGAGAWGTTLAIQAARQGLKVRLWARRPEVAGRLAADREHQALVPGQRFPSTLEVTSDPASAVEGAGLVLWVVPSHAFREVARRVLPHAPDGAVHVSASKGIEDGSFATMTSILTEESGGRALVGALSGPSFAKEVARGLPTAVTLAASDPAAGRWVQGLISTPVFRLYTSADLAGVQLGGALKNVYAIAAGICDGLGLGLNARAALITRGIMEMSRLAVCLGANPLTLSGLSGTGDLFLTCTGELSRNRQVGLRLGAGEDLEAILAGRREVAEGVRNAKSVWGLAQSHGLALPTAREVYRVLYEGKQPRQGLVDLLTRRLKEELPSDLAAHGAGS